MHTQKKTKQNIKFRKKNDVGVRSVTVENKIDSKKIKIKKKKKKPKEVKRTAKIN